MADMASTGAASWSLKPGDSIRRLDLHAAFGGSRQGGTIPSSTSPNIFLFADPSVAAGHGYYDGWVGDHFYYTGHGQHGDQQFRTGNRAVLHHVEHGRAIRVFRGGRGTVTYLGEFELEPDRPFFRMEAPESGGGPTRQVIVFRLRPKGEVIHADEDELTLPAGISADSLDSVVAGESTAPIIQRVPVEQQHVETVEVAQASDSYTVTRREQTLVLSYANYLESRGSVVSRLRVQPEGEARQIVSDLFDETRNNLVEAKGTGARGDVRMAIGQLYDYRRFAESGAALGVLLPTRPRADLEALLHQAGISAVWPAGDGFADNADGRFSGSQVSLGG